MWPPNPLKGELTYFLKAKENEKNQNEKISVSQLYQGIKKYVINDNDILSKFIIFIGSKNRKYESSNNQEIEVDDYMFTKYANDSDYKFMTLVKMVKTVL